MNHVTSEAPAALLSATGPTLQEAIAHVHAENDRRRTPRDLFDALNQEFKFHVDLAADAHNHLLPEWLGPGSRIAEDALAFDWSLRWSRGRGWLNPPYSRGNLDRFLAKCAEQADRGFTVVTVTPYMPSEGWFARLYAATEIREIPHRVPFLKFDGTKDNGAKFPSAISVFRPQPGIVRGLPRRVVWSWRTNR